MSDQPKPRGRLLNKAQRELHDEIVSTVQLEVNEGRLSWSEAEAPLELAMRKLSERVSEEMQREGGGEHE